MRHWIVQGLLPLLTAALLLLGVIVGGQYARERLRAHEHVRLAFASLERAPPSGQSREDFLTEVQYWSGLPDRIDLLTSDAPDQLRQAFEKHPLVESVRTVRVLPGGKAQAELVYRTPVLWVLIHKAKAGRAVDRLGVLLPGARRPARVPELAGVVTKPPGTPGTRWQDGRVESAARLAAFLLSHHDRLCPKVGDALTIRFQSDILTLTGGAAGQEVVWGHAPGAEVPGEAAAEVKLQRLLERGTRSSSGPLDLRTAKGPSP